MNRRVNTEWLCPLLCSLMLALSACGEPAAESCPVTFTACGGDLTGVWRKVKACVPMKEVTCAEATITWEQDAFETISFSSNLSYSYSQSGESKYRVTYPAQCLQAFTSCEQLSGSPGALTVVCSGDISVSCTCHVTGAGTVEGGGSYSLAGDDVVLQPTGSQTMDTNAYCVAGDSLYMQSVNFGPASAVRYERQQ